MGSCVALMLSLSRGVGFRVVGRVFGNFGIVLGLSGVGSSTEISVEIVRRSSDPRCISDQNQGLNCVDNNRKTFGMIDVPPHGDPTIPFVVNRYVSTSK